MLFNTNESFILASSSPRRKELFSMLQLPFEIKTADVEEQSVRYENDQQYVKDVALLKAMAIFKQYPQHVVIGADTIVSFNGELLHKPKNEEEALRHLQKLSGQTHEVLTGVVVCKPNHNPFVFVETTKVTFKSLDDAFLNVYISTNDPFDKAGGYGIQTIGMLLVEKIDGDYNNVVGLPLARLTEHLLTLNCIAI